MKAMTGKEIASIIRKKYRPDERIMIFSENARDLWGPDDGWAFDTAFGIIKTLSENHEDNPESTFYFTVGRCDMYEGENVPKD